MRNRTLKAPHPSDWADDDLLSLAEAVKVFYPDGPLTVASLRLRLMRERCRQT